MTDPSRTVPLVLAAGTSSRYGAPKMLALLDGQPVISSVLSALDGLRMRRPIIVVGGAREVIRAAVGDEAATWVVNSMPEAGLSSSVRLGIDEVRRSSPDADAVLVLLGDQPLVSPDVIRRLLDASAVAGVVAVAPRYAAGGGANPVLLLRAGWPLADEASGDRGLGPLLAALPEDVMWVDVDGDNPDVDTPADLALVAWAARVRANREQVERIREVPDGVDFYAPVSSLFRADPARSDDPVLDALLEVAEPGETWLDIGAGAGRYALPLARHVHEVIALDPSAGMLEALRVGMADHGIANIRPVEGRWPPADVAPFSVDVALIAHVGYDVEDIGSFLRAMEAAARRHCIAILMERTPAAVVGPFWPVVHGEERVHLPALPEFLGLLESQGRRPVVRRFQLPPRTFESRDQVVSLVRRQLWVRPGSPKDELAMAHLDAVLGTEADGVVLGDAEPLVAGIAEWAPQST